MPTFNQLVKSGRQQSTYKSTAPALQRGLNTLENKALRACFCIRRASITIRASF